MAIIKVGAATETELKEKKARVEDAMHATRAAVEEGIVPGGGVALVRAIPALDELLKSSKATRRSASRSSPLARRAAAPDRRQRRRRGRGGRGQGARAKERTSASTPQTGEFEDLVKAGVIDPTKVTRTALQNAASIAA